MAISQVRPGTQADTMATVWDLAEGFAILASVAVPDHPAQAQKLLDVSTRMRDRALEIEREELADLLNRACDTLRGRVASASR